MKLRKQIILTLFFPSYLLLLVLTDISLSGFWTDFILSLLLTIVAIRHILKATTNKRWLTITTNVINSICALSVIGFLGCTLFNKHIRDTFKLRSFYFQSVEGRLFNAYFKPVGAYSGGYGNFWITETPKYFPIIEWPVYYDRTVHHDFGSDEFDSELIDNYAVVRSYITEEVINERK